MTLSYTIMLSSWLNNGHNSYCALKFCQALLSKGHRIDCIFFYHDSVQIGSSLNIVADDEMDLNQAWRQFAMDNQLHCKLCTNNALRRGIIDDRYAKLYHKEGKNLMKEFSIAGLAELMQSIAKTDRFIQF